MFGKIFVFFSSFFHHDTVPVQQEQVIVVSVPEDEIMIENVRPELVSVYY